MPCASAGSNGSALFSLCPFVRLVRSRLSLLCILRVNYRDCRPGGLALGRGSRGGSKWETANASHSVRPKTSAELSRGMGHTLEVLNDASTLIFDPADSGVEAVRAEFRSGLCVRVCGWVLTAHDRRPARRMVPRIGRRIRLSASTACWDRTVSHFLSVALVDE